MNNIQNLWYGNLRPATEPGINDRTCSSLSGHIDDKLEKLTESLDENGKARLARLRDDYSELLCNECESAFVKGFSLGAKLTAEAFCNTYKERE